MSLNFNGTFTAPAEPQWMLPDGEQLPPLVIPDGQGPWAIRYIWVKHLSLIHISEPTRPY